MYPLPMAHPSWFQQHGTQEQNSAWKLWPNTSTQQEQKYCLKVVALHKHTASSHKLYYTKQLPKQHHQLVTKLSLGTVHKRAQSVPYV